MDYPAGSDLHVRFSDGYRVVVLSGEWDMGNVSQLADVVTDAIGDPGLTCFDLRAATFMDSTVLGQLVRLHKAIGDRLTVRCAQGTVLRVLRIGHLDGPLNVSVDEVGL